MTWRKAFIWGVCIYLGINIISYVLFVCFGLGYYFSNLANKISEILAFPMGTGKNYNFYLSTLFWSLVIAAVIKIIIFSLQLNNHKP